MKTFQHGHPQKKDKSPDTGDLSSAGTGDHSSTEMDELGPLCRGCWRKRGQAICSWCEQTPYCSKKCQKDAWLSTHRVHCTRKVTMHQLVSDLHQVLLRTCNASVKYLGKRKTTDDRIAYFFQDYGYNLPNGVNVRNQLLGASNLTLDEFNAFYYIGKSTLMHMCLVGAVHVARHRMNRTNGGAMLLRYTNEAGRHYHVLDAWLVDTSVQQTPKDNAVHPSPDGIAVQVFNEKPETHERKDGRVDLAYLPPPSYDCAVGQHHTMCYLKVCPADDDESAVEYVSLDLVASQYGVCDTLPSGEPFKAMHHPSLGETCPEAYFTVEKKIDSLVVYDALCGRVTYEDRQMEPESLEVLRAMFKQTMRRVFAVQRK